MDGYFKIMNKNEEDVRTYISKFVKTYSKHDMVKTFISQFLDIRNFFSNPASETPYKDFNEKMKDNSADIVKFLAYIKDLNLRVKQTRKLDKKKNAEMNVHNMKKIQERARMLDEVLDQDIFITNINFIGAEVHEAYMKLQAEKLKEEAEERKKEEAEEKREDLGEDQPESYEMINQIPTTYR